MYNIFSIQNSIFNMSTSILEDLNACYSTVSLNYTSSIFPSSYCCLCLQVGHKFIDCERFKYLPEIIKHDIYNMQIAPQQSKAFNKSQDIGYLQPFQLNQSIQEEELDSNFDICMKKLDNSMAQLVKTTNAINQKLQQTTIALDSLDYAFDVEYEMEEKLSLEQQINIIDFELENKYQQDSNYETEIEWWKVIVMKIIQLK